MKKNTKDVICLAVGQTYEMVVSTSITAHPNVSPYPNADFEYLIPIKKGGALEYLYRINKKISCLPDEVYKYKQNLNNDEYNALIQYHELRKSSFGYGKTETKYVFYILGEVYKIKQPFEKKGIQVSVKLSFEDVPIVDKHKEEKRKNLQSENLYVGITDTNWMNFIKAQKENLGQYINFWTPGTKIFKAIEPGELFLFKLHAKKSKGENGEIVGGAYFESFEQMDVSEAWERFGYGNGCTSYFELKSAIDEYRIRNNMNTNTDIGCIILKKPFFLEKDKWVESPVDWSKSIVSGKKYSTVDGIGYDLYQTIISAIPDASCEKLISEIEMEIENLPALGRERNAYIKTRVNQGIFRNVLLKRYNQCCLCNVKNPSFLIASHIKPWAKSMANEKLQVDNGLLLCPNHDSLFDEGYISFDDNGRILISEQLSLTDAIFMNVNKDMKIHLTEKNKTFMKYHREHVFRN